MKDPSSVITKKMLQNFYTPIQIYNHNILSFLCWFRGKSELPLIDDRVKIVDSCVKNCMDLKTVDQKYLDLGTFSSQGIFLITGML